MHIRARRGIYGVSSNCFERRAHQARHGIPVPCEGKACRTVAVIAAGKPARDNAVKDSHTRERIQDIALAIP
jgi:hypothetical protein